MNVIKPGYKIMGIFPDEKDCLQWLERIGRTCYKSEDRITEESAPKFVRSILKLDRMDKLHKRVRTIIELGHADKAVEEVMRAVQDMLADPPHESVIEHSLITVRFVFDRGISHEMVRHRLCAFSQESTRYCNYAKEKPIKADYVGGKCPDCGEPIADEMEEGEECVNCRRVFNRPEPGINVISPSFWDKEPEGSDGNKQYSRWFSALVIAQGQYDALIENGAKPQEARSVLPNSLKTEIVVTANFREWRHIFRLRTSKRAHPQMREVMVPLLKELQAKKNLGLLFEDIEVQE